MTHSGGKPHAVGDRGQRYEVRYVDGNGAEKVFGWSEQYPEGFVRSINLHPTMHSPRVIDRQRRWLHKKRGTTYTEIGRGKMQSEMRPLDMEPVVIYRADADGSLWVRLAEEFEDGRFEPVPPEQEGSHG